MKLLTGADFWSLHPEPAAGLRRLVVSDGPAGARGETWDERDTSANVPSPTALAATWDEALVERLGGLLAAECPAQGRRRAARADGQPAPHALRRPPLRVLQRGPAASPGGSASPTSAACRRNGVGATVKHFVANDSETQPHDAERAS